MKLDWIIEKIGGGQYLTMWGWTPHQRDALRFDTSEDADIHIRKNRTQNAQPVTASPIDTHAAPTVRSDYNPFGTPL